METKEIKNLDALNVWDTLTILKSPNSDIPNFMARYAIARAYDKLKQAVTPLFDEKNKIIKKYYELGDNNQVKDLKEGMSKDDFNNEMNEFLETTIEVEIYKIKLSTLTDASVFTVTQQRIAMPADYILILKEFIIDDIEESENKPDIPKKVN